MDDVCWWTASATAKAVQRREISAIEVAEAYLRRCHELEPLRAIVALCEEELVAGAQATQKYIESGEATGRLTGVPFTVKDLISTAGTQTAAGSKALAGNIPSFDAPTVARLRAEGGLLLAKTACPEFGFGITTESALHGVTLNPWDYSRSPGGSSGGESALIAAGGSPLGLGTDYGGSVRWPAHSTGICALRPTPGRVPGGGQIPGVGGTTGALSPALPDSWSVQGRLQVVGLLARSVADLELGLSVISGYDEGDMSCIAPPYRRRSGTRQSDITVSWCTDDLRTPVNDDVAELICSVTEQMARDGFRVVHRPDALAGGHERYNDLRGYDPLLAVRELVGENYDGLSDEVVAALETSVGTHRYSETTTRERAATWRREFLEKLQASPILIAPVAPCAAVTHDRSVSVAGVRLRNWELMAYCRAVSLAGVPTIAVPCGRSREGLPLAIQVIAPPFREDLALDVSSYLEATFGGCVPPPAFQASRSLCEGGGPQRQHRLQ